MCSSAVNPYPTHKNPYQVRIHTRSESQMLGHPNFLGHAPD